ncbi:hypothetical protein TBLA_0B08150 [Henningerozyma blattae CBS 6284]|uniref:Aldehyde dehydrogenase domain-containing protein n=1 Tax=Henningerozyma blattae (strain ATCC 34711 / CBS 6284 / DSM 70876 / NBRC 10599 / NRRL Y-10934 / UCD 77-7) TaxID=1071380 RepID=I2GZS9_HENB6|nr:hypothetical protein TBLA_0B08150 [Tetrapisispora blattae CBS 6284]CCH59631.1 hypothetical protein TBLA_0B08150 [Tetrapisispora blattae CBS 6284]
MLRLNRYPAPRDPLATASRVRHASTAFANPDLFRTRPFVGGKWREPSQRIFREVLSPADSRAVAKISLADDGLLHEARAAAHTAHRTLRAHPRPFRQQLLLRLSEMIDANVPDLSRLVTLETGKPFRLALDETRLASSIFKHTALCNSAAAQIDPAVPPHSAFSVSTLEIPNGVCVWNAPYLSPLASLAHFLAHSLVQGNASIIVPSPLATLTALSFGKLSQLTNLLPGLINVLPLDSQLPDSLPPPPSEKHYVIIQDVQDTSVLLEEISAKLPHMQSLHLIINENCYQQVKQDLIQVFNSPEFLQIGNPFDESNHFGPLANVADLLFTKQLIMENGHFNILNTLPDTVFKEGNFFLPMIIDNILPEMDIFTRPIVSPIVTLTKFLTPAEVTRLFPDTPASNESHTRVTLFSNNYDFVEKMSTALNVDTITINSFVTPYILPGVLHYKSLSANPFSRQKYIIKK